MNKAYHFFLLAFLLLSISCQRHNNVVKILKVTEHNSAKVSDSALFRILERETGLKIEMSYDLNEEVAIERLWNKTIDMAIIPSNTIVSDTYGNEDESSIRTVLPLLPRFLMILTSPGIHVSNLKELLENNVVLYEDMSAMDSVFFENLFLAFNINPAKVVARAVENQNLKAQLNPAAVYVGLTHLHNPFVLKLVEKGWSMFSLDKVSNYGHGSNAEGFQMAFPWAYPFVFPKSFYEGQPEEPALTVAIQDVLVTRDDFDDETVYKIVETLIEHKANLVRQNNIYQLLPTEINNKSLSFPLSKGTLHYLNRDKPSIWFKYANMIWPLLSMLAILAGAFASFQKRLKRRLKERADTYYAELIKIRSNAIYDGDGSLNEELLEELRQVRNKAFHALKSNKLLADESFSIFLKLYQEIADEIQQKSESNQ